MGELDVYENNGRNLNDFLSVRLEGCGITNCRLVVSALKAYQPGDPCTGEVSRRLAAVKDRYRPVKLREADFIGGCALRQWLDSRRNDLVVYGVSPRQEGAVELSDELSEQEVGGRLGRTGVGTVSASDTQNRGRESTDIVASVIGFSQLAPYKAPTAAPKDRAVFGWVVRPSPTSDGGWAPSHHRLAAVVSAPSWWKRLEFDVTACWVRPGVAAVHAVRIFEDPGDVCSIAKIGEVTSGNISSEADRTGKSDSPASLERIFRIQLPRRVADVTERFNFDFIKTPYFDNQWVRSFQRGRPPRLEVGRPGRLVLPGERLWRGTVVTLGELPADSIVVLPDMKGVIASFKCVPPPPGFTATNLNTEGRPETYQVKVWTSEGRTRAVPVRLMPFSKRSYDEVPCNTQLR